jgi:hypothetical protein
MGGRARLLDAGGLCQLERLKTNKRMQATGAGQHWRARQGGSSTQQARSASARHPQKQQAQEATQQPSGFSASWPASTSWFVARCSRREVSPSTCLRVERRQGCRHGAGCKGSTQQEDLRQHTLCLAVRAMLSAGAVAIDWPTGTKAAGRAERRGAGTRGALARNHA